MQVILTPCFERTIQFSELFFPRFLIFAFFFSCKRKLLTVLKGVLISNIQDTGHIGFSGNFKVCFKRMLLPQTTLQYSRKKLKAHILSVFFSKMKLTLSLIMCSYKENVCWDYENKSIQHFVV